MLILVNNLHLPLLIIIIISTYLPILLNNLLSQMTLYQSFHLFFQQTCLKLYLLYVMLNIVLSCNLVHCRSVSSLIGYPPKNLKSLLNKCSICQNISSQNRPHPPMAALFFLYPKRMGDYVCVWTTDISIIKLSETGILHLVLMTVLINCLEQNTSLRLI